MHEIASSVLDFFLSPFNWIVILIIISFILRKPSSRKSFRIFALCIFIIFGNKWLLNSYAKNWQPAPVSLGNGIVYNCGIVPGGFASPDAEGNGYFNATSDRFIEVVKLFKLGKITHILISGGNGKADDKDFREGLWVKGELTEMGIPDSIIYIEDRSNNTADNAVFAKKILDSILLRQPYLLITSAVHMPRASLLFRNAGLPVTQFPCNYIDGRDVFSFSELIPKLSVLLDWNSYLKETAGYCFYYIKGKEN